MESSTLAITRDPAAIPDVAAAGISLDEWVACLSASSIIRPVQPRAGINPFTKQHATFQPSPGAAFFETATGRCTIEHRDGAIIVIGATDDALPIIYDVARSLRAKVKALD